MIRLAIVFGLMLAVAYAPGASAELAKEGSYSNGKYAYHGTANVIVMGKERLVLGYQIWGPNFGEEETPFKNTTFHCVGIINAIKGQYKNSSGFCRFTDPDGDTFFYDYTNDGVLGGRAKGHFRLTGGTGKFEGITGSGETMNISMKPAVKGTFQGHGTSSGKWKLP